MLLKNKLLSVAKEFQFVDVDYLLEVLSEYYEGQWIQPYSDHMRVFDELHQYNVVCKMIIPLIVDNRFKGYTIKFMYKHDLNYSND